MDPINPWLDPIEVRRMAERLMQPAREQAAPLVDPGFDEAFIGFGPEATQPSIPVSIPGLTPIQEVREMPAHVPPRPPSTNPFPNAAPITIAPRYTPGSASRVTPTLTPRVMHVIPEAQVAIPVYPLYQSLPSTVETPVTARGPFLERITRFRDWMRHNFAATGIFILDREGAVIYDESNHGRLHFLARSLALASRRPGATGRNVHVKISAGATLEVIPVETPYGCLVLGAVVPESLNPPSVSAVMNALLLVASPPSEG